MKKEGPKQRPPPVFESPLNRIKTPVMLNDIDGGSVLSVCCFFWRWLLYFLFVCFFCVCGHTNTSPPKKTQYKKIKKKYK